LLESLVPILQDELDDDQELALLMLLQMFGITIQNGDDMLDALEKEFERDIAETEKPEQKKGSESRKPDEASERISSSKDSKKDKAKSGGSFKSKHKGRR
jgi:hypothetical protein